MCSMVVMAASSEMLREAISMTGAVIAGASPDSVGLEMTWTPFDEPLPLEEIVSGVSIAPRRLRLITSGFSLHDSSLSALDRR